MANSPFFPSQPALTLVEVVQNPVTTQNPDLTPTIAAAARHGDTLISETHGKYGVLGARGNIFLGSTTAAGVVIPASTTNLASTFTLWNPLGSNVNVELLEIGLGAVLATTAAQGYALGFQFGVGGVVTAPGSLTALTSMGIGASNFGAAPQATLYSAATLVNAAVLAPLLAVFGATAAVTDIGLLPHPYCFDGKVVLPPGSLCVLLKTAAGVLSKFVSLLWAEHPI